MGGHDKLGSLEARNELAGLSSGSVPCAVVWSLVMSELIQRWTLSGLGLTSTSGLECALGETCLAVGAGSFMQVKELMGEVTIGQGNIRE